MAKVMVSLEGSGPAPTVDQLVQKYGLAPSDIDRDFGVIATDPAAHHYTVLVEEAVAGKITGDRNWSVHGPYSNPRIATFEQPGAPPPRKSG